MLALEAGEDEPWTAPRSRRRKEPPISGPLPERLYLVLGDQIFIGKGGVPFPLRLPIPFDDRGETEIELVEPSARIPPALAAGRSARRD